MVLPSRKLFKSLLISSPMFDDTTLVAIVRNEKENTAGGIQRFLDSHLPLFEKAVIVDTGSTDGTREVLNDYASSHTQLHVHYYPGKTLAQSRNFSIREAKTKYACQLDADELLTPDQAKQFLENFREFPSVPTWLFKFLHIFPDGSFDYSRPEQRYRFFNRENLEFEGIGYERALPTGETGYANATILHFLPQSDVLPKKEGWYANTLFWSLTSKEGTVTDTEVEETARPFKQFNPMRDALDKIKKSSEYTQQPHQ